MKMHCTYVSQKHMPLSLSLLTVWRWYQHQTGRWTNELGSAQPLSQVRKLASLLAPLSPVSTLYLSLKKGSLYINFKTHKTRFSGRERSNLYPVHRLLQRVTSKFLYKSQGVDGRRECFGYFSGGESRYMLPVQVPQQSKL